MYLFLLKKRKGGPRKPSQNPEAGSSCNVKLKHFRIIAISSVDYNCQPIDRNIQLSSTVSR